MSNLKTETLEALRRQGKSVKDVRWVGHADGFVKIDLDYFLKIADREYDAGFGSNEVNGNLVVVGDDWWLARWEYDGSEGWEFNTKPLLKSDHKFGGKVFVENYEDTWGELSNLEYLEIKDADQSSK